MELFLDRTSLRSKFVAAFLLFLVPQILSVSFVFAQESETGEVIDTEVLTKSSQSNEFSELKKLTDQTVQILSTIKNLTDRVFRSKMMGIKNPVTDQTKGYALLTGELFPFENQDVQTWRQSVFEFINQPMPALIAKWGTEVPNGKVSEAQKTVYLANAKVLLIKQFFLVQGQVAMLYLHFEQPAHFIKESSRVSLSYARYLEIAQSSTEDEFYKNAKSGIGGFVLNLEGKISEPDTSWVHFDFVEEYLEGLSAVSKGKTWSPENALNSLKTISNLALNINLSQIDQLLNSSRVAESPSNLSVTDSDQKNQIYYSTALSLMKPKPQQPEWAEVSETSEELTSALALAVGRSTAIHENPEKIVTDFLKTLQVAKWIHINDHISSFPLELSRLTSEQRKEVFKQIWCNSSIKSLSNLVQLMIEDETDLKEINSILQSDIAACLKKPKMPESFFNAWEGSVDVFTVYQQRAQKLEWAKVLFRASKWLDPQMIKDDVDGNFTKEEGHNHFAAAVEAVEIELLDSVKDPMANQELKSWLDQIRNLDPNEEPQKAAQTRYKQVGEILNNSCSVGNGDQRLDSKIEQLCKDDEVLQKEFKDYKSARTTQLEAWRRFGEKLDLNQKEFKQFPTPFQNLPFTPEQVVTYLAAASKKMLEDYRIFEITIKHPKNGKSIQLGQYLSQLNQEVANTTQPKDIKKNVETALNQALPIIRGHILKSIQEIKAIETLKDAMPLLNRVSGMANIIQKNPNFQEEYRKMIAEELAPTWWDKTSTVFEGPMSFGFDLFMAKLVGDIVLARIPGVRTVIAPWYKVISRSASPYVAGFMAGFWVTYIPHVVDETQQAFFTLPEQRDSIADLYFGTWDNSSLASGEENESIKGEVSDARVGFYMARAMDLGIFVGLPMLHKKLNGLQLGKFAQVEKKSVQMFKDVGFETPKSVSWNEKTIRDTAQRTLDRLNLKFDQALKAYEKSDPRLKELEKIIQSVTTARDWLLSQRKLFEGRLAQTGRLHKLDFKGLDMKPGDFSSTSWIEKIKSLEADMSAGRITRPEYDRQNRVFRSLFDETLKAAENDIASAFLKVYGKQAYAYLGWKPSMWRRFWMSPTQRAYQNALNAFALENSVVAKLYRELIFGGAR